MTTDSFEEALTEVVNLGGDTDTAGAILGALAGAYYGATRSPNGGSTAFRIAKASRRGRSRLAQRSRRGLHIPDLITTERSLTRKEGESFESFASMTRATGERGADHLL